MSESRDDDAPHEGTHAAPHLIGPRLIGPHLIDTHRAGPDLQRHGALLALLAGDVDALIDALCAGRPMDLVRECREHVEDNAYFIEEDRVAARAIARLAHLAGTPPSRAMRAIEELIVDATADVIEDGPLAAHTTLVDDDPLDDDAVLVVQLSRGLGVSLELVRRLLPRLNAFAFEDRHVVYHCLVRRMTPRAYAERFDDDPQVVQAMLEHVAKLAIGE